MKTTLTELQEYSNELIRNGVTPEEYMSSIPVKIFGIFKKDNERKCLESAYNEGFFDGRRFSDKRLGAKIETMYSNGHDYFVKNYINKPIK